MKRYTIKPLQWNDSTNEHITFVHNLPTYYIYKDIVTGLYDLWVGIYKTLEQVSLDEAKEKARELYEENISHYLDECTENVYE